MKRLVVLAGLILGFSIITMSVSAQTTAASDKSATTQTQKAAPACQGKTVDTNNDGACVNHQKDGKTANCTQYVDKNGDGKCDNCQGKGTCIKETGCGKGNTKADGCPPGCGKGKSCKK
jgi:hypothetical protein